MTVNGVTVVSLSGGRSCPALVEDAVSGDLDGLRAVVDGVAALTPAQRAAVRSSVVALAGQVQRLVDGPGPSRGGVGVLIVRASAEASEVRITLGAPAPDHPSRAERRVDTFILTLRASRC